MEHVTDQDLLEEAFWAEQKGELERASVLRDAVEKNRKLGPSVLRQALAEHMRTATLA